VVRHLCRSLTGSITAASTTASTSSSSSGGELLIAVEPALARIAAGAQPLPDSAAAASLAAAAAAGSTGTSFAECSSAAASDAAGVHWAAAGELLPLAGRRRLCCRLQAQLGGSTSVSSAVADSASLSSSAHSSSSGHGGSGHGGSSSSCSSFNMCLVLDDPMQLLLVAYEGPASVQQPTANGSSSSSSHGSSTTGRRSPSPAPQHELGRIVGAIPYAHAAAVSHGLDRRAVELWAERSSAVNSGLTTAAQQQQEQQQQQLVPASALQARPSQSGAAVVAAAAAAVMNASAAALASAAAAVTGLPMANSNAGSSSSSASSDPAQPHIVLVMESPADRAAVCAHVDSCRRALSCARLAALQDLLRQVIDALAVEGFGGASPVSTAPGSPEPACE
jgi:hypothetical protein